MGIINIFRNNISKMLSKIAGLAAFAGIASGQGIATDT